MNQCETKRQRRLYKYFQGFVFIIKNLPFSLALRLGKGIGLLMYYLSTRDRRIAVKNVANCPLLGGDPKKIAKDSFKHMGLSAVEFIKASQLSKSRLLSMVRIEGREYIEAAFTKGRGVILITPHLGNWELLGIILSLSGYPMCPLVKTQRGNAFDQFVNDHRRHFGMQPIPVGLTLRPVLGALKKNQMCAYVMDQNPGQGGIEAVFLGRKTRIARGAAVVAQKTGAQVLAGSIIRIGPWRHLVKISPIDLVRTEDPKEDIRKNTQLFSQYLSAQIMEAPEQWLWSYKRKWEDYPVGDSPITERQESIAGQAAE